MAAIVEFTKYDYRHRNAVDQVPYGPGTLLKLADGATVHVVDAYNKLRAFRSGEDFLNLGFKWEDIISVDRSILGLYGPELTSGGVGTGSWGTFITVTAPLVLEAPTIAGEPNTALAPAEIAAEPAGVSQKTTSNSKRYLLIGGGILLAIGAVAYMLKKKK